MRMRSGWVKVVSVVLMCAGAWCAQAGVSSMTVDGSGHLVLNEKVTHLWGLRVSSVATREEYTAAFLENLKELAEDGVNAISLNYQGGPGLSAKTFSSDGKSFEDVGVRDRVRRIVQAADEKNVVVIVTLFFPRKMGVVAGKTGAAERVAGQDPRLGSREAYVAACRTAATELKDWKNVMICVVDQPLTSAFAAAEMKFGVGDVVECLAAVEGVNGAVLRGAGCSVHETNVAIGKSAHATVNFHCEAAMTPPRFAVGKPIIHLGMAGPAEAGRLPQGIYSAAARQVFSDWVDRYLDASTAHFVGHFPGWTEGGAEMRANRFDIGGGGIDRVGGIGWYLSILNKRTKVRVEAATQPAPDGKSIFDK